MTEEPLFSQVNLVVADMEKALEFYRRLGVDMRSGPGDWPPGSGGRHAESTGESGIRLELDNPEMARIWHAGLSEAPAAAVIGFSLSSRQAVDELYADLTAAGYAGRQPPYDAFWGARYAIVQDPDGNDVGLMSPIDPAGRYTPNPRPS
jgi:catechol 2,3-dioxygenase-like lactoylglutathione lyase family enzyme